MTGAISNYRGMVLSLRRRMAQGLQFGFFTPSATRWTKYPTPATSVRPQYRREHSHPAEPLQHSPVQLRQRRLRRTPLHFGELRLGRHRPAYLPEARPESAGHRLDDLRNRLLPHRTAVHGGRYCGERCSRTAADSTGLSSPLPYSPDTMAAVRRPPIRIHPVFRCQQFAPSTNKPTGFGNQTRNQYRGPGYFNTDMSITKNFKIPHWEGAKFGVGLPILQSPEPSELR